MSLLTDPSETGVCNITHTAGSDPDPDLSADVFGAPVWDGVRKLRLQGHFHVNVSLSPSPCVRVGENLVPPTQSTEV